MLHIRMCLEWPTGTRTIHDILYQVASQFLLPFNGFKQGLEITRTETIKVVTLNNLDEDSWSIHQMLLLLVVYGAMGQITLTYLGEKLQQIAIAIEVDEDMQSSQSIPIFLQNHALLLQPLLHHVVVGIRYLNKLDTPGSQIGHIPDDVVGAKSNMLNSGTGVKVDIFLDLGALLAPRRLVDRHLYDPVR